MKIRFGQIKKGNYFFFAGQRWKRSHGCFAVPVNLIDIGHTGMYFGVDKLVEIL